VAVSTDGVTVLKRFEEDEFPVPAIAFEFESQRDEEVTVTLTDEVPEGVEVEDLGFHPEYGSEYWTIDEDRISFEKTLDANVEYTTVYGIRATGTDDVEQFLTEPVLDEVDPPLPDGEVPSDDIVPESDDDIVKDVIAGDGEVPGLEDDADVDEEEIETLDLKDPNADDGSQEVTVDDSDGADQTEDADVDGSVVAAMAAEIRSNDVPMQDLKLLQRAIDQLSDGDTNGSAPSSGARDARIERLQTDIADLRAYTDALEEFLEENGTGEQLIEDFESQLESFSSDLDAMESELAETSETVESVASEMSTVSSEMDEVTDEVGDIESSVSEMEESVETLQSAVEELETEVTEGDVAGRLDTIEEELTELRDWQDQIKSTFGG
jgi:uncharacterized protein YoxC